MYTIRGVTTNLRFYAGGQWLDDLVDRKWSGWGGAFLVLVTSARWSGYYRSTRSWVQTLAVCVLIQSGVPRFSLVLPHHEPGQRQVLDWWDTNEIDRVQVSFKNQSVTVTVPIGLPFHPDWNLINRLRHFPENRNRPRCYQLMFFHTPRKESDSCMYNGNQQCEYSFQGELLPQNEPHTEHCWSTGAVKVAFAVD